MSAVPFSKPDHGRSTGVDPREPTVERLLLDAAARDLRASAANAMAALRSCVGELQQSIGDEGIDAQAPLGVFSKALQNSMTALALFMDISTERVEERADTLEQKVWSEVKLARATIDQCRAETALTRERTRESEEVRKVENLTLARTLGKEITETIKTTALAREVRFNRRQNWSGVALVGVVLFAVFVGGVVWSGYWSDHAILTKCLKAQQPDETGKSYWCPMTVVRGAA